jgi:hypothetical protein
MAECDLTEMGYGECEDANGDVEEDGPVNETKTPMGMLDALRALPPNAKKIEVAKYVEPGYGFSLLKFYSAERVPHKVAFTVSRRTLPHPAGQGVSESTFSTHAAFADELRTSMSPKHIAMLVKTNRNHTFLFWRIIKKIMPAYFKKFGKLNAISAAELAEDAAAAFGGLAL